MDEIRHTLHRINKQNIITNRYQTVLKTENKTQNCLLVLNADVTFATFRQSSAIIIQQQQKLLLSNTGKIEQIK